MKARGTRGRPDRLDDYGWIEQNEGESPAPRGVALLEVRTCPSTAFLSTLKAFVAIICR